MTSHVSTTTKSLLVEVPDYENAAVKTVAGSGAPAKNAYLELGEASARSVLTGSTYGADLLPAAFNQPGRAGTAPTHITFLDDIRNRGTSSNHGGTANGNIATPPSESDIRSSDAYSATEATASTPGATGKNSLASSVIPDYVGWRDHTDGHRITTTRGDKIEVIGGNYKIVSLGRGTGVAVYEMAGGVIVDAMEAPGNQTSVTWRECPTEALTPAAQTVAVEVKNAYLAYRTSYKEAGCNDVWFDSYPFDGAASGYHERFTDDHAKDLKRAVDTLIADTSNAAILKDNDYHAEHGGNRLRAAFAAWTGFTDPRTEGGWKVVSQTSKGHEVERYHGTQREEFYGDKLISVTGAPAEDSSGLTLAANTDGTDEYIAGKNDLGFSTEAYPTKWDTRCADAPAKLQQPEIYESTWARSVTEYTVVAGNVNEESTINGTSSAKSTFKQKVFEEEFYNNGYTGVFHIAPPHQFLEINLGAKTELFVGASTWLGLANRFEMFVGAEQQVNLGISGEIVLGAQISLAVGPDLEVDISKTGVTIQKSDADLTEVKASLSKTQSRLKSMDAALSESTMSLTKQIRALKTDL